MNIRTIAVVAFALTLIATASQADTVINRIDSFAGAAPSLSAAVITDKDLEFWVFSYNDRAATDVEVGRLWPVAKGKLLVGAYAVVWPDSNKLFVLPWVSYRERLGDVKVGADLAHYTPLNGGPHITFANSVFARAPLGKRADVGVASSFFWEQGGSKPVRFGPSLQLRCGTQTLNVDYQPWTLHGVAPRKLRVQVASTFR